MEQLNLQVGSGLALSWMSQKEKTMGVLGESSTSSVLPSMVRWNHVLPLISSASPFLVAYIGGCGLRLFSMQELVYLVSTDGNDLKEGTVGGGRSLRS